MSLNKLSKQAQLDRVNSQRSLYYLCKEVLGYKDMVPHVHGDLSFFATHPQFGRFRQATVPRSWFKTWVVTIGKSIWLSLPDEEGLYREVYPYKGPNVRILIAAMTIEMASKMLEKIRQEWMTNERLKEAFPELLPDYNKTRWSNHCAEVRRTIRAQEGTYTTIGVGGSVISQHFDHIIEDDLIYATKDDFTGQELMPSQEDIDNAIGWHKLAFSLLANPKEGGIDNVGTRWAPHDLVDYIRRHEKQYSCFEICATTEGIWPIPDNTFCNWPERYDKTTLESIRDTQGRIFETQYLNRPRAGEDVTFDVGYLKRYDSLQEYPTGLRLYTFVDLASWGDKKRICRNVVLTGAKDEKKNLWIFRVDAGRYNPTEVIDLIKAHQKQFNSRVLVEEVGYQIALRHFARKEMEASGFYNIEPIPRDGRKGAKEMRIHSVEPIVRNGALHVLGSMKDLIQEMEDYPYGATKDILDVLGYLQMHAQPFYVEKPITYNHDPFLMENIEKELYATAHSSRSVYPFSNPLGE